MTMTNAEWMMKQGYKFHDLDVACLGMERGCRITINGTTVARVPLVNTVSAIICWLDEEHKDPILDNAEHQYLSAVIKPFRNKVKTITKHRGYATSNEYLEVYFCTEEVMEMPFFNAGTMYKGMEVGKHYTLEELGL